MRLYGVVRDDNVRHLAGEFEANIRVCKSAIKIICVDQAAGPALLASELYNGEKYEQKIPFSAIRLITVQDGAISIYGTRRNITIQLNGNKSVQRHFQTLLTSPGTGHIFQLISENVIISITGADILRRFRVAEIMAGSSEMQFFANAHFGLEEIVPRVSERLVTERAIGELVGQQVFDDALRLIARVIRRYMLDKRA